MKGYHFRGSSSPGARRKLLRKLNRHLLILRSIDFIRQTIIIKKTSLKRSGLIFVVWMSVGNNNESQLKNPDLSGAIFTLSLSILILNSQCVEGARDVRVIKVSPITKISIV